MANKNSTQVTNFLGGTTLNPSALQHGKERVYKGTVALATGDLDANDTVMLAAVPSNLRIHELWIYCDDLDSNGSPTLAADIGLYKDDSASAPTVKDSDAYASAATTFQAAVTEGKNLAYEARDIANIQKRVFEDAGDTSDPGGYYLVGIKWTTGPATAAAGDISWVIKGTAE